MKAPTPGGRAAPDARRWLAVVAGLAVAAPALAQRAALVRDIDRPAAQPVGAMCQTYFSAIQVTCKLLTVPAGKRLVVESVTWHVPTIAGQQPSKVAFGLVPLDGHVNFVPGYDQAYFASINPFPTNFSGSTLLYAGSQALRFYADEGRTVRVELDGPAAAAAGYEAGFGLSGYLVDK
ncbi:MAG: hypothetical protein KGN16_17625 [Burkholderiales bacterium]|nr:hypothetical protein [Burkholderiales bacterium]